MFDVTDVFHANWQSTAKITINQGGTSCFDSKQLVITEKGSKPISQIKINDIVKCYNEETKEIRFNKVINTFKYKNTKKTIKLKLKNGKEIIATEDHLFFYEGGWYSLKHLLYLKYGNMETDTII